MTRDDFRHDRSRYERPSLGWRCGRATGWGRPCVSGPGPDGTCPHRDSPCAPRRMHAQLRGRIALVAAALVAALIVLLAGDAARLVGLPSSLDAGPLSAAHAVFIGEEGCASCHSAHGRGAAGWLTAALGAVRPGSAHAIDGACTSCHGFGGHETLPHNATFETRAELQPTSCVGCHTEHRGESRMAERVADAQCKSCHSGQVHGFSVDHPAFPPEYPSKPTGSKMFDHASHLTKHFVDPRNAQLVPKGACMGCHASEPRSGDIRIAGYDAACAGCHDQGIARRELLLMRWPELEPAPAQETAGVCGTGGGDAGSDPVSLDPPNALLALLLGSSADDPATYGEPLRTLARAMVAEGSTPIVALAGKRLEGDPAALLRGLAGETARLAACAWTANREYEASSASGPGWRAEALEIRYAAPGHGDPVIRVWLDAFARTARPQDAEDAERFEAARAEILGADGPGQCLKCHASTGPEEGPRRISWSRPAAPHDRLNRFDHRPHVTALGGESSCTSCHKPQATRTGTGLASIARESCADCHRAGLAGDNCLTCHAYHQNHALKPRMAKDAD